METPRPAGLKPTLRQMLILVVWAAIMLAAARLAIGWRILGYRVDFDCLTAAILIAGWPVPLLMTLLFFLDRRGPIRGWYLARCMSSWGLFSGLAFVLADPICWSLTGRPTITFPLLPAFGVAALVALPSAWRSVTPGRCLTCGRKAVIAVATRFGRGGRTDSGWCAACGASYERKGVKAGWEPVNSPQANAEGQAGDGGTTGRGPTGNRSQPHRP